VLPECNPILGSPLTAAATQVFSRDVRKRPAYVLCFSTRTIALRQELVRRCGLDQRGAIVLRQTQIFRPPGKSRGQLGVIHIDSAMSDVGTPQ